MKSCRIAGSESRAIGPSAEPSTGRRASRARAGRECMTAAFEDGLLVPQRRRVAREEAHRDAVVAGGGEVDSVVGERRRIELVGDLQQQPGAVAGARIAARRAAMGQVRENLEPLLDDLVRRLTRQRGDEPEPAGVVLEAGSYSPWRFGNGISNVLQCWWCNEVVAGG